VASDAPLVFAITSAHGIEQLPRVVRDPVLEHDLDVFDVRDSRRGIAFHQGDELFIPFRDATSGKDTYGAGRYVEAEPLGKGRYLLDFNRAYNPYCAYNDDWRCPLPPAENWLTVAIRAGEKSFH